MVPHSAKPYELSEWNRQGTVHLQLCRPQPQQWGQDGGTENRQLGLAKNKDCTELDKYLNAFKVMSSWLHYSTDSYFHDFVFVSCVLYQISETQQGNLLKDSLGGLAGFFLDTLVALHFTPVSKWPGRSFELA